MKKVIYLGLLLASLSAPKPVQAQAQLLVTGVAAALRIHSLASSASPEAPVVTTATYRASSYLMQRTPPAGRGILGGDQISYLERQLDQCRARLAADSTSHVCAAAQLSQLQATRTAILAAQPKWPVQLYDQEIAFYTAEDTRRQPAAAPAPAPAK